MTAEVVIEPSVTTVVIGGEETQLNVSFEQLTFDIVFEDDEVHTVTTFGDADTVVSGNVDVTIQREEINVAIYSDIAPGPEGGGGGGGGSGSSYLPAPDLFDDTGATYFYFAWLTDGTSWRVRRQSRATYAKLDATLTNNPTVPDLATAWPLRATLTY